MRARASDSIGDVLLDQRVVAGIGNVFKSEILFGARVHPLVLVSRLSDADLERVLDVALEQLRANVMRSGDTLSVAVGRRTTRSLDPHEKLWVYGRGGRRCRICGHAIRSRAAGPEARLTYWCPECQRAR